MVKGVLSAGEKMAKWMKTLMAAAWRSENPVQHGTADRGAKYVDLHVFKPIKAILRQPIMLIGKNALAGTARTASASQYGL